MAAMTVHLDSSLPPAAASPGSTATRPGSPLLREAQAPVGAAPSSVATPPPISTAGTLVHISAQGRQSLGQAAAELQNQTTLLQALSMPLQAGPPPAATRTATPTPPRAAPRPSTTSTPTEHSGAEAPALPTHNNPPVPASAWLQSYGGHRQDLPALPPAATRMLLAGHAEATTTSQSTTRPVKGEAVAQPASMHWPSHGVGKPLHTLVQTLVQQATALLGSQRVLAAQHWPAALVPVVDPQPPAQAEPDLAPLQTWLVHQGVVQTREGPRGVSITLRVPTPWLRAWEQAQAAALPPHTSNSWPGSPQPTFNPGAGAGGAPRPLQAVFVGPSASLQSGTLALALESPGMAGMRTSALMLLEFQPLLRSSASAQASTLYGRHAAPHLRQDPWLHMATIQASGHVHHEEDDMVHPSAALCDTPGCPYQGETACVQPFCMALRGPTPVDALAGSSSTPGPHTPGLR